MALKNGVLTVSRGIRDARTYVMADEFNAWYIDGDANEVETLSIGKESTFGGANDAYVAVNEGDYVILVLDKDDFVTDLYFYAG